MLHSTTFLHGETRGLGNFMNMYIYWLCWERSTQMSEWETDKPSVVFIVDFLKSFNFGTFQFKLATIFLQTTLTRIAVLVLCRYFTMTDEEQQVLCHAIGS